MAIDHYILNERNEIVAVDWLTWAKWFENAREQRIIRQNLLDNREPWIATDMKREREHIKRRREMGMSVKASNLVDLRALVEKILVSTVFLGMDHGYGGRVLLFETMVFRGPTNDEMDRYATLAEAIAGHERIMLQTQEALKGAWDVIEGKAANGSGK